METLNLTSIIVALLSAIPPTCIAYLAWKESKRVHTTINSRMDQLLASEKKISKSEGREEMKLENNEIIKLT